MNDLITRQQLAEQIPCALSVIDEARASGRLAYIQLRPGGKVFFRQEHIDAWLARCTHPAKPLNAVATTYRKHTPWFVGKGRTEWKAEAGL